MKGADGGNIYAEGVSWFKSFTPLSIQFDLCEFATLGSSVSGLNIVQAISVSAQQFQHKRELEVIAFTKREKREKHQERRREPTEKKTRGRCCLSRPLSSKHRRLPERFLLKQKCRYVPNSVRALVIQCTRVPFTSPSEIGKNYLKNKTISHLDNHLNCLLLRDHEKSTERQFQSNRYVIWLPTNIIRVFLKRGWNILSLQTNWFLTDVTERAKCCLPPRWGTNSKPGSLMCSNVITTVLFSSGPSPPPLSSNHKNNYEIRNNNNYKGERKKSRYRQTTQPIETRVAHTHHHYITVWPFPYSLVYILRVISYRLLWPLHWNYIHKKKKDLSGGLVRDQKNWASSH